MRLTPAPGCSRPGVSARAAPRSAADTPRRAATVARVSAAVVVVDGGPAGPVGRSTSAPIRRIPAVAAKASTTSGNGASRLSTSVRSVAVQTVTTTSGTRRSGTSAAAATTAASGRSRASAMLASVSPDTVWYPRASDSRRATSGASSPTSSALSAPTAHTVERSASDASVSPGVTFRRSTGTLATVPTGWPCRRGAVSPVQSGGAVTATGTATTASTS